MIENRNKFFKIIDYNNNQMEEDNHLVPSSADVALATHDYTNRSLTQAADDRCFPCTYQGCVKVISGFIPFSSVFFQENPLI